MASQHLVLRWDVGSCHYDPISANCNCSNSVGPTIVCVGGNIGCELYEIHPVTFRISLIWEICPFEGLLSTHGQSDLDCRAPKP